MVDCPTHDQLDIAAEDSVAAWFAAHTYDLVINCAAATNVDGCEADVQGAYLLNATGAGLIAQAAAAQDAKVVQVSTDYVFAGNESGARSEDDATGPLSAYGKSKLEGERLVQAANPRHFICRTAWLYGACGKNFVKTMLRLGAEHNSITVVSDQFGNPTNANDVAYEILKVAATQNYGIYHMTNEGTCSWADFAEKIMEYAGLNCRVERVTSQQYKSANPASARRPHYSSLENARLAATVGNEMRPWQDALRSFLREHARES